MVAANSSALKKLKKQELEEIINCKSFKQFKLLPQMSLLINEDENPEQFSFPNLVDSFLESLNSFESTSLNLTSLASLILTPTGVGTWVLSAISFLSVFLNSLTKYEKVKNEQIKKDHELKFMNIKKDCFDELISRQQQELGEENQLENRLPMNDPIAAPEKNNEKKSKSSKHFFANINESFDKFLDVSAKLFNAFITKIPKFLGFIGFVGAATVLGGNVGIAVGLGLSAIIGGAYAYNYFTTKKDEVTQKKSAKELQNDLAQKEKIYLNNETKLKAKKNPQPIPSESKKNDPQFQLSKNVLDKKNLPDSKEKEEKNVVQDESNDDGNLKELEQSPKYFAPNSPTFFKPKTIEKPATEPSPTFNIRSAMI